MKELVPLTDSVNKLRMVKTSEELKRIAKAEAIGDKAFAHILDFIRPGQTEMDVANELGYQMRRLGAQNLRVSKPLPPPVRTAQNPMRYLPPGRSKTAIS